MEKPKCCSKCKRHYVGEGYKEVCTPDCFFDKRIKNISQKRKVPISKINDNWINRDFKEIEKTGLTEISKKLKKTE